MDVSLSDQAIKSALTQNWKEAIRINLELVNENKEDVAALNRLAYAYLKSGTIATAKTTYKKVLKIDKYNPIALKNLKWLNNLTKNDIHQNTSAASPTIFLEEPGKTKIVTLVNPAPFRVLCNIMTAQQVSLQPKKHSIEIRTGTNVYIGALPDDLSHRLLRLIAAGNQYDAYIKNVEKNTVSVFIKEIKRSKRFSNVPSFSITNGMGIYGSAKIGDFDQEEDKDPNQDSQVDEMDS
jgi:tetratricopeptide (TPR) repeat protein